MGTPESQTLEESKVDNYFLCLPSPGAEFHIS